MISPNRFIESLKAQGIRRFTGVPCSFFQKAIHTVLKDSALHYTMVPNEGSALALASGACLAGDATALFIQNSGFGNLINPLTSLNMIYGIPVLIFMSGRAYGVSDEPQHEIIGRTMTSMLDALGVRYQEMPDKASDFEKALGEAINYLKTKRQPFFFIVKKGAVEDEVEIAATKNSFPMKRVDAIRAVTECLQGNELVIATTGKPSRELFAVHDRPGNFYMQGSMGHAASIGLGVALSRPEKKVVVLDGDGALLMHYGIISSVGFYKPKNFYHIVLDNEAYETTGDQDTTSSTTDFQACALAAGYRSAKTVREEVVLKNTLKQWIVDQGPCFLRVKINREPTAGIGRISAKYTSPQIVKAFQAGLSV